jgi:hypothetical protein
MAGNFTLTPQIETLIPPQRKSSIAGPDAARTRSFMTNAPLTRLNVLSSLLSFVVAVMLCLAPSVGAAQTIVGFLKNQSDSEDLKLIVKESKEPLKIFAQPYLISSLRSLRDGNLIVASGLMDLTMHAVRIDAIQTLGLQELIGTWQSSRWEIFEFRDFSRLNLYMPMEKDNGSISMSRSHSLAYAVTPESGDRYSIFISDQKKMMVGTLRMYDKKLELTVYDSDSGNVAENISLSPISLK